MASRKKEKGVIIIYHADCPDGFGAAYAAWKKFGDKAEYIATRHEDKPIKVKDKHIYFLDIVYKAEDFKRLAKRNIITTIDHHVSALPEVQASDNFVYALDHSGAVLAWRYFHPKEKVPQLLLHIEDGDLWLFKLPRTAEVRAHLSLMPYDMKTWDGMAKDMERSHSRKSFIATGALLLKYDERLMEKLLPGVALVEFEGHKIYALNAPRVWRDTLGNRLARKKPPFAIVWRAEGSLVSVGLRGTGKIDLSKLAGKYGGGGHHDASGFSFRISEGFPWKIISK